MKLSDIKGDRVFDVVADLVTPIANIAEDKAAMALFERKECPKGTTPREFMVGRIKKALPTLLKEHKEDLVAIFSTLKGVTPDEYRKELTLAVLMTDVFEMMADEELLAFLS